MEPRTPPTSQLKPLLANIIDYAGLFPPAKLPLDQAIRNYVSYLTATENWMLSRFIIPARQLPDLTAIADSSFPAKGSLVFSILGRGGHDQASFFEGLQLDLMEVNAFRAAHGGRVKLDMFETRLPSISLSTPGAAKKIVKQVGDLLLENGLTPFFEAPFDENWQERAEVLIHSLKTNGMGGFKLRSGGVEAHMFPTTAQVAWAIATVRDNGVSLKATAGLHHPVRHYNESVQTKMHGFLNVFGAGVLAKIRGLPMQEIEAILSDEDPAHFRFDQDGFHWQHLSASHEEIEQARRVSFLSFGSCSFDEPREDLNALGLLSR